MPSSPKSPKEIVKEALEAFDLEFDAVNTEVKNRLISTKQFDGNLDTIRICEELRQIKLLRNSLGSKLEDRVLADRLIGRLKNIRQRVSRIFGSDR